MNRKAVGKNRVNEISLKHAIKTMRQPNKEGNGKEGLDFPHGFGGQGKITPGMRR